MSKVICVCNQKGGTGKSTTVCNLGIGLARLGKKVLLIDGDSQGSLTASLGYKDPDSLDVSLATIMEKLINDEELASEEGILHHQEGIDLMPANIELAALEVSMVNVIGRERILKNYEVRIMRIGMAGSLAYEVHGDFEYAIETYQTLLEVGKEYGIKRLGRHAYWNTHTEGGFPQFIIHFPYAWEKDPGFMKWMQETNCPMAYYALSIQKLGGSMGTDLEPRYMNPLELGFGKAITFKRDYIGKEALEKIAKGPHREMVTLEWNVDDIMDIYRSEFEAGEPYAIMEGPEDYLQSGQFEYRADKVLSNGKFVGISTGRIISWYYRSMVSLAVIDPEYAKIGTDVIVLWGDEGTRQKEIRAKVTRFPYHAEGRNDEVDVSTIPSGIRK